MLSKRTTILDLPYDILFPILHEVAEDALLPIVPQEPAPWPPEDDPERSSAELLASVCPRWREIMSTTSSYWKRLVIWIGRDPTPLLRNPYDARLEDTTEQAQLKAIIGLLLPHMKRWRVLCIKSLYSSSLPLPRIDLVGRAENLVQLALDFIIDDSVANLVPVSRPVGNGEFRTPVLNELTMSAVHFHHSKLYSSSPRASMLAVLSSLHITDYASHNNPFPLIKLMTCLARCPKLTALKLENLHLDCTYTGPPISRGPDQSWIIAVHFIDMPGDVIAEYHRLLNSFSFLPISYIRCTMPSGDASTRPVGPASEVHVDGIQDPATLLYFLSANLNYLTISHCHGLTPSVLDHLANLVLPQTVAADSEIWLCRGMDCLTIEGCTQFTSADLRAMLQARYAMHKIARLDRDDPEFVVTSVEVLEVCNCCELAPEDKEWFNEHLGCLVWDEWEGGNDPEE